MAERARVLKVGGVLLGLLVVGLVVGFLLANRGGESPPDSSPSPTTDVRAQVEQAYLRQWDVYAEANLKLDTSRLEEVLTGDALRIVRDQIEEQKAKNQPVRIRVEHDYRILLVDEMTATVEDNYVNHSQRLDLKTGQPVEPDPNQRVRRTYTLKKVNGTWKVSFVVGFK